MREKLIEFETAKLAKEKGFIESCKTFIFLTKEGNEVTNQMVFDKFGKDLKFDIDVMKSVLSGSLIKAPTQFLLQKWLREKYNIDIIINPLWVKGGNKVYTSAIYRLNVEFRSKECSTYEEALEEGLIEALKLIKE